MRRSTLLLFVAFSLFATPPVLAQVPQSDVALKLLYDPDAGVGDAQGVVLDDNSGVVVALDDKNQTATIQFVKPWHRHKLSLTITAAVDKEAGTATFLGFNEPIGDEQAKLEYNYIDWPDFSLYELFEGARPGSFRGGEVLDALLSTEALACRDAIATLKQRIANSRERVLWSGELDAIYGKIQKLELPTREEVEEYLKKTAAGGPPNLPTTAAEKAAEAKVQRLIQSLDQEEGVCADIETLMPHLYSVGVLARGELTSRRSARIFGINSTVGRKEFSFLDRDLLQSEGEVDTTSEHELPVNFGLRFGWIFLTSELEGSPESSLIFSFNRERGYEAADALTFCQPAEGLENVPVLETCKEIPGSGTPTTRSKRCVSGVPTRARQRRTCPACSRSRCGSRRGGRRGRAASSRRAGRAGGRRRAPRPAPAASPGAAPEGRRGSASRRRRGRTHVRQASA